MRAMVLNEPGRPLELLDVPAPVPGAGQVLLRVRACGVCRTDLHVVDGQVAQAAVVVQGTHSFAAGSARHVQLQVDGGGMVVVAPARVGGAEDGHGGHAEGSRKMSRPAVG